MCACLLFSIRLTTKLNGKESLESYFSNIKQLMVSAWNLGCEIRIGISF